MTNDLKYKSTPPRRITDPLPIYTRTHLDEQEAMIAEFVKQGGTVQMLADAPDAATPRKPHRTHVFIHEGKFVNIANKPTVEEQQRKQADLARRIKAVLKRADGEWLTAVQIRSALGNDTTNKDVLRTLKKITADPEILLGMRNGNKAYSYKADFDTLRGFL